MPGQAEKRHNSADPAPLFNPAEDNEYMEEEDSYHSVYDSDAAVSVSYSSEDEDDDDRAEGQEDEDMMKQINHNMARWRAYYQKQQQNNENSQIKCMSYDMKQAVKLQLFDSDRSFDMLMTELNGIIRKESLDIFVDSVGDDVHHWTVEILDFQPDSPLQNDLYALSRKYNYSSIQLRMKFTRGLYPSLPPAVDIIRPRLKGPMLGALCSHPMLQLKFWDPFTSLYEIILKIKQYLQEFARVDLECPLNDPNVHGGGYYQIERLMAQLEALDTIKPITDPEWQHVYDERKVDVDESRLLAQKSTVQKKPFPYKNNVQNMVAPMMIDLVGDVEDFVQDDEVDGTANVVQAQASTSTQQKLQQQRAARQPVWAAGTGYGTYSTKYDQVWNSKESCEIQMAQDENIRKVLAFASKCIISEMKSSIVGEWKRSLNIEDENEVGQNNDGNVEAIQEYMMSDDSAQAFVNSIKCSGIVGCLVWHLKDKNILEINDRKHLYYEIVLVLGEFCRPEFQQFFQQDVIQAVQKLNVQGQQFLKMAQENNPQASSSQDTDQAIVENIFKIINQIYIWCTSNVREAQQSCKEAGEAKDGGPKEESYVDLLSPYTTNFQDIASTHGFRGEVSIQPLSKIRTRRLAQEFAGLDNGLPVYPSSSIFVCCDNSKNDLWRALIIGPEDTPYSCGCFIFDIGFPDNYPSAPPKVLLKTTGQGSVRFNPNLYNNGKVCLSLLGTWSGMKGEAWDPNSSSVLQVVISIQSLILVDNPYFNEPGFEASSSRGMLQSEQYTKNIRIQTMKFAILDMLKNPPQEFADVIRLHFKLRKKYLLEICEKWVQEEAQNNKEISKQFEAIKEQLQKL